MNVDQGRFLSRRNFLRIAGLSAGGFALYELWSLSSATQKGEKLRRMNEWQPQVVKLLLETVEADRLDNLEVFNGLAKTQFVTLVKDNTESLLSSAKEAYPNRYNLLAFALGEHYGLQIPRYDEGQTLPFDEDTLSFLDRSLTRVGLSRIREKSIERQANMWVEALYRSYAAAWEIDPTNADGVYLPENQSIFGRMLAPNNRFIRLQPHS